MLAVLAGLVWVLNHKQNILAETPLSALPPVGRFFDPYHGFWTNAASSDSDSHVEIKLPGILKPVSVIYDLQRIPHIFAANDPDLYFAQGYITAKDRLWQMEFQTMAGAGRISEIIGQRALDYDRFQRRLGMTYGAERSLDTMMKDAVSRRLLLSYTAGINAWIDQLDPRDFPIEYKLLDYAPEHWSPLKCMLLLKSMAATLSAESDAASMTANLKKFGPGVVNDLFPDYPFQESPVIPQDTKWPFKPLAPEIGSAAAPAKKLLSRLSLMQSGLGQGELWSHPLEAKPGEDAAAIGSNNWAVSGSRTASGRAMLANDPHLTLSLPSIWYAVQLNAPGINVEGVSLPGAPGVIIGFNDHITWGVTNVGAGVLDIYHVEWKDRSHTAYRYNGGWRPPQRKVYEIKVRGRSSFRDTVMFTHQGPVVQDAHFRPKQGSMVPGDMAVRWTAHEGFNELKAFYLINKAGHYNDFVTALKLYGSPGQNFAYADDQKNIAMWVNGKFPVKYRDEGKYILEAKDSSNEWKEYIPHDQLPHVLNPPRGFVSSANQSSTAPDYPYYINWQFGSPYRALRINSVLGGTHKATADSLRRMQTDVFNTYAREVLPLLITELRPETLNKRQKTALGVIRSWRYLNDATATAPAIFEQWATNLQTMIWDEFDSTGLMAPSRDRTLKLLLTEPTSPWFDIKKTKQSETRSDVITASFKQAIDSLSKNFGKDPQSWQWYRVKSTSVMHLLNIDAFSRLNVKTGGGSGIIDAITHRTGPSWRMVVEPGPKALAYGVYPGGQSGNPGSFWYDNMLNPWIEGKSYRLIFWTTPAENVLPTLNTIKMNPNPRYLWQ